MREFFRELAEAAGYALDWIGTGVGAAERNALYVARDLEALMRAFPGLTAEVAMHTNDRREYEAFYRLERLMRSVGERTLTVLMRESLSLRRDSPD